MIDRRMLPWLVGMVALILLTAGVSAGAVWYGSDLAFQVNAFYSSQSGSAQLSDDIYQYWDTLSQNSYTLQQMAAPMITGCVATVFALIAVLARRWDITRGRSLPLDGAAQGGVPGQAEATVAS